MTYSRFVLGLLALSQLVLGALTLVAPAPFFAAMGLATPPTDTFYLIGMLASRFLVIGVVLVVLARRGAADPIWLGAMLAIQLIDLGVGLYYTGIGVLPLAVSGFPMANAAILSLLLVGTLRPSRGRAAVS